MARLLAERGERMQAYASQSNLYELHRRLRHAHLKEAKTLLTSLAQ
jgi:hypothetical protein